MKYLIIGPSGSGKDTLADTLTQYINHNFTQEMHLKTAKSFTTRAKRTESEDTHYFISDKELINYEELDNMVAVRRKKDGVYFFTKQEIENSDIFIADPDGARAIAEALPHRIFTLINIVIADKAKRDELIIKRTNGNQDILEQIYRRIAEEEESQEYNVFNNKNFDLSTLAPNILGVLNYQNDYTQEHLTDFIHFLTRLTLEYKTVEDLMPQLIEIGFIGSSENGRPVKTDPATGELVEISNKEAAYWIVNSESAFEKLAHLYFTKIAAKKYYIAYNADKKEGAE